MPFEISFGILTAAKEKEKDERLFRQWLANFTPMSFSGKFKSFEEYKTDICGQNVDLRPTNEIIEEAEEIERRLKANGNGNI